MDLREITQCRRDLDFKPLAKTSDTLPSVAWNGYLLTGFDRSQGTVLNLKSSFPQLVRDCYPNLSLVELARLLQCLESLEPLYSEFKEPLLAAYQLIDHPELDDLFLLLLSLPFDTQNWLAAERVSAKQLYPLYLVLRQKPDHAVEYISRALSFLRSKKANQEQIARALELSANLLITGKEPFQENARTVEIWLRYLELCRHPQERNMDSRQEEKLQKLPWPSHVQTRWVRDGELSGIEVTFNIHNPQELEKMIDGLESMTAHLKDDLWKTH